MVKIDSPIQADRVRRRKPPYIRIIVAEGVVVKPGFPVQVLALVAYVVPRDLAGLAGFSEGVAPDLVVHTPDDFSLLVGQLFGRAVDVVVEVQHPHGQACFARCQVAGRALRSLL